MQGINQDFLCKQIFLVEECVEFYFLLLLENCLQVANIFGFVVFKKLSIK
jgi:hypothetical protein